MRKGILIATGVILTGILVARCAPVERLFLRPMDPPEALQGVSMDDVADDALRTVVEGLDTPWEIVFLPDGGMLVTERPGRLLRFPASTDDRVLSRQDAAAWEIEGVVETGEGGLMGLALHPDFERNGWIYVMFTARAGDGLENRVERYRLDGEGPTDRTVVFDGIPGARFHNGGRIAFGPDGHLYVTTGDAGNRDLAQERASLAGKILRLTEEGDVPEGNPFGLAWWSYGHRNPQGLAWDEDGRLWSTEHGRSGLRTGLDEVNLIEPGGNYGWPIIEGDEERDGMMGPAAHSGPDYVWAPGGVAWVRGTLYFGGLRGEALYETETEDDGVGPVTAHFARELGRVRAVAVGPDHALYFGTSNRDGRGTVREGDDRIMRLLPEALNP